MDTERLQITLGTYAIQFRAKARMLVQVAGILLLLWGVFNMFVAPLTGFEPVAPYRVFGPVMAGSDGAYYIGDALVMCAGAIIAWFV